METKYAVIIQCDIAMKRCSGLACTDSFYNREGLFKDTEDNVKYISFTCGGCCGKGVGPKLANFAKRGRKLGNIKMENVTIHLASCIVNENHHSDRCPHVDVIKDIIRKKGYENIAEGTYISKTAQSKREQGIYNTY